MWRILIISRFFLNQSIFPKTTMFFKVSPLARKLSGPREWSGPNNPRRPICEVFLFYLVFFLTNQFFQKTTMFFKVFPLARKLSGPMEWSGPNNPRRPIYERSYGPHNRILHIWASQKDPSHMSPTIGSFTYGPHERILHIWASQ